MRIIAFIGLWITGLQGLLATTECTSSGNGNWNTSFNCVGSGVPLKYIIRAQDTITVNVAGTSAIDTIEVWGQLIFNNGRKVDMSSSGIIYVMTGGSIIDGDGGSKFDFATGQDVPGPFSVTGPAYAKNSTGGVFVSIPLPVTWLDFNAVVHGNYIHHNPVHGIHYYRVKQTDQDGSYSYSDHWSVTMNSGPNLVCAPNPAIDRVNIFCEGNSSIISQSILKLSGEKISVPLLKAENSLDISSLAPGTYLLHFEFAGGNKKTVPFQKL
jgi:hypothetical protein